MRTVTGVADFCSDVTDLPPKKRVWGFRAPVRQRIRKSASQVAESRRKNADTPVTIALGRWFYLQPDPIGLMGGLNLYAYALNNAISNFDRWGLFGEGGLGAKYKGHRDFTSGGFFDYNLEDTDKKTNPINGDPERHFRDLSISEVDVAEAIASCHKEKFERAMHRGHDYFTHYAKGYRYMPKTWGQKCLGYGHACDGTKPDEDPVAWNAAETWTKARVREWDHKCGCISRE